MKRVPLLETHVSKQLRSTKERQTTVEAEVEEEKKQLNARSLAEMNNQMSKVSHTRRRNFSI